MKNNNAVEVILFSRYSLTDLRRKELVRWLETTLQCASCDSMVSQRKYFLEH